MEDIWSVAKEFFPSEVQLARKQIEGDAPELSSKTRVIQTENTISAPQPAKSSHNRKGLAHQSQHVITLIPNNMQDTDSFFSNSRKGSLKSSIEIPIRNLETSLNRFNEMYGNFKFDAEIWGNISKSKR
jgi:hypothetical protein